MNIREALAEYQEAQLARFEAKDAQHGEDSVTRKNVLDIKADIWELRDHLEAEFNVLVHSRGDREAEDAVDLGNMSFLVWWHKYETQARKDALHDRLGAG